MFGELEIGDRIDEQIAQDFEERNVSVGQAVKALVLTGLGFVQQRLYLTAQFFEKMPTDRLIGEEVRPDHLNDDVLGRALDDLYDYGVIRVQQGYSRDHRPDLNQAVLDMIIERKAGLPVLIKPLSGNASDPGSFPELIDRHVLIGT